MTRNLLITGIVSVVMGLFTLVYRDLAPPQRGQPMQAAAGAGAAGGPSDSQPPDSMTPQRGLMLFRDSVRPLLASVCLKCHDSDRRSGGLDLTRRATALDGGETGAGIVPGKPEESLVFQLVTAGEMPEEGPLLSREQVAALKEWIEADAPYEEEPVTAAGAAGTDSPGPATMGSTVQAGGMMGGASSPNAPGMMMCPCMQMMQQMMGGSGMMGQPPATGQTATADKPYSNPRTAEQARERAEEHLKSSANPNLEIGQVGETVASYEIQVVTQDGSLVNWIIIDKQSGRIRTLYSP